MCLRVRQGALSGTAAEWFVRLGPVSEQPGRYQRSASGMVGAMVVLLLVVGAFVGFRALNREELEVTPERIDYLEAVGFARESGLDGRLSAVGAPGTGGPRPSNRSPVGRWGIGFLTPDGFAGLHQSDESSADMLETYVDEETSRASTRCDIDGASWEVHEDADGDRGYVGEVEGVRVLVYGSAPSAVLQDLAGSLTTEPLS